MQIVPMSDLKSRSGLPDALRVLVAEYPRDLWTAHDNFDGLVQFWLDRHLGFRRMVALMQTATEGLLNRDADPQDFARNLSRLGNRFITELHGHHQIEDSHFFPLLGQREPRLVTGFDLLETDHHAIDLHLDRFVTTANTALQAQGDRAALQTATGAFSVELAGITRLLDRHLTDEEELVVPVILHHGSQGLG